MRTRNSIGGFVHVRPSVCGKTSVFDTFCVCLSVGSGLGCGCPCPPVRNYIVTPRHLFRCFLCMCLSWKGGRVGHWVRMGVGCPCPPIRNNIVTPHHLSMGPSVARYIRLLALLTQLTHSVALCFAMLACCFTCSLTLLDRRVYRLAYSLPCRTVELHVFMLEKRSTGINDCCCH